MNLVVSQIIELGGAVKEFRLRRPDGAPLPAWSAGAHIQPMLCWPDGRRQQRHYSLVGAPGVGADYRIAVLLDANGQGGSRLLHEHVKVGDVLVVDGPFNSFSLAAGEARTVLIAGGIGITPLVSMAHQLSADARPFELHYLARSAEQMVLLDDVAALPSLTLTKHVSQGARAQPAHAPGQRDAHGASARADLNAIVGAYSDGAQLYACGPVGLMQGIERAAAERGWPVAALHFESYGARVAVNDRALTVHLAQSQMSVEVAPGTTILDALVDAGMFVSYECKRGECGACYTQVLEGAPLHRDVCLTGPQRAIGMCPCVSWSAGETLVLDL
jgi:ferredoxin-NADP reductase